MPVFPIEIILASWTEKSANVHIVHILPTKRTGFRPVGTRRKASSTTDEPALFMVLNWFELSSGAAGPDKSGVAQSSN
jgi:hypothetical protein